MKTKAIKIIDIVFELIKIREKANSIIINPVSKFNFSSIFFRLYLSIMVPQYSPQKRPKKVTIPNNNENVGFKSSLSVKYQGIAIILIPEDIPEII